MNFRIADTFTDAVANSLRRKLQLLVGNELEVADRIEVHAIDEVGRRLYAEHFGEPDIADEAVIRRLLAEASTAGEAHRFSDHFL